MNTIEVYAFVCKGISGVPADQYGFYVTFDEADTPKPRSEWQKRQYWKRLLNGGEDYLPLLIHIYFEGDMPVASQRDEIDSRVQSLTGQLLHREG